MEANLHDEKDKERQLKKEINELNLQIHTQKVQQEHGGEENSGMLKFLREEIAKKSIEVSNAQRDYRELLEKKMSLPERAETELENQSPNIQKLQMEIQQIKDMLVTQSKDKARTFERAEEFESPSAISALSERTDPKEMRKALLGDQKKIEVDKKNLQSDKKALQEMDPMDAGYDQKKNILT